MTFVNALVKAIEAARADRDRLAAEMAEYLREIDRLKLRIHFLECFSPEECEMCLVAETERRNMERIEK